MKKNIIIGIVVIVLLIIYFSVTTTTNNSANSFNERQGHTKITSSNRDNTPETNKAKVEFCGIVSSEYTQIKEYGLVELKEKYDYALEIYDKISHYSFHCDDSGNIIKIHKHASHYQSVSKRSDVLKKFENMNCHITSLGASLFNTKNRDGMHAIIYALDRSNLENHKLRANLDEITEVEMIPVTIEVTNPNIGLEINTKMNALLLNTKRDYISSMWKEDERFRAINLEDYISSEWVLYPVYIPPDPDYNPKYSPYIIDHKKGLGVFLPELRVNLK